MFNRPFSCVLLVFAAVVCAVCGGCDEQETSVGKPNGSLASPEESFEEIVNVLEEGLELPGGQASGFVTSSSGASSRFQVHNTVDSKFIPPAGANEPYRGEITVTTHSIYSLRKLDDDDDEDDRKQPGAKRNSALLEESAEAGAGFSSFDESLVTESKDNKSGRGEIDSVHRRADKIERKFELVFENNRWVLLTKVDKENDTAIEKAFSRALSMQP